MDVETAIRLADTVLRARLSRTEGGPDPRWHAIIAVGAFLDSDPDRVWSFILEWGRNDDGDVRGAIGTCLLEHLLERHFDSFFERVVVAAEADANFADTVATCWKFGQATELEKSARFDAFIATVRARRSEGGHQ